MILSNKVLFICTTTITFFIAQAFGQQQQQEQQKLTTSQESLMRQLFANNANVLKPQETLELLKTLKSSFRNDDKSTKTTYLIKDLENLIEAGENTKEKCRPDLFVDYLTIMKHLDPKTYRLMIVFDYYNGAAWNNNIFTYLKYYHNEQYKQCLDLFKATTKEVCGKDLKIIENLAKSVENGSPEIPFPLIVPDDIERAVLNQIKANLSDINSREQLLSVEGLNRFDKEFDKIKMVCNRLNDSITDNVEFAQHAYFSYLRDKVEGDKFLIRWSFYSDICQLINAISEDQRLEILKTLTKTYGLK